MNLITNSLFDISHVKNWHKFVSVQHKDMVAFLDSLRPLREFILCTHVFIPIKYSFVTLRVLCMCVLNPRAYTLIGSVVYTLLLYIQIKSSITHWFLSRIPTSMFAALLKFVWSSHVCMKYKYRKTYLVFYFFYVVLMWSVDTRYTKLSRIGTLLASASLEQQGVNTRLNYLDEHQGRSSNISDRKNN